MNCPHCEKELPDNYGAVYCPHCGKGLPAVKASLPGVLPPFKIGGLWALAALLLPPLLTMVSAAVMNLMVSGGSDNEGVTPMIALIGGAIGGAACGTVLGLKIGKTVPARVGLSILFAAIMIVVCITLCLIGCTFGGYRFVIR